MANQEVHSRRQPLQVEIEASLAYEFLMSICAFSDVESYATYEVGKAWFEAARAKASSDLIDTIQQFSFHSTEVWEHMLAIVFDCPPPRDVPTLLAFLKDLSPLELRLHQLGYYDRQHRRATPPDIIYHAAQGDSEAQKTLIKTSFPNDANWQRTLRWLLSLDMVATKNVLLDILSRWYHEVFQEQEAAILPILERDVEAKRALAATVSPEQLIELATGLEYIPGPGIERIVLIPSYILRPWNADAERGNTMIFCYPVAEESIIADPDAPPTRLVNLTKALADERRLRILKKLSTDSYTLQELAEEFNVAKTTMHHHLITLRSAGLIRMRTTDKRYSLRPDMIESAGELLERYLFGTKRK
jgi:DNA-binding transcriptional ArsR family regulator